MSEFDFEPIRGLPEPLPPGEGLLWQGAPQWGPLAQRAFHVRAIGVYFSLLILLRFIIIIVDGDPLTVAIGSALWLLLLGLAAMVILTLLAWFYARSTVYSITDRRIVIRFGLALPMAVNIPFKSIEAADLISHDDGTGDIFLKLIKDQKVNYWVMWPNVRPWYFFNVQPMLRALADAKSAGAILAAALRAVANETTASHPARTADESQVSATT